MAYIPCLVNYLQEENFRSFCDGLREPQKFLVGNLPYNHCLLGMEQLLQGDEWWFVTQAEL